MSDSKDIDQLFANALGTARRREPRLDMPEDCYVVIDGTKFPLGNFSPNGFYSAPYKGDLSGHQTFAVEITVRHEAFDFTVKAEAVVVRRDQSGLAAKLVKVIRGRKQIDAYFRHHFAWLKEKEGRSRGGRAAAPPVSPE